MTYDLASSESPCASFKPPILYLRATLATFVPRLSPKGERRIQRDNSTTPQHRRCLTIWNKRKFPGASFSLLSSTSFPHREERRIQRGNSTTPQQRRCLATWNKRKFPGASFSTYRCFEVNENSTGEKSALPCFPHNTMQQPALMHLSLNNATPIRLYVNTR